MLLFSRLHSYVFPIYRTCSLLIYKHFFYEIKTKLSATLHCSMVETGILIIRNNILRQTSPSFSFIQS